MAFRDTVNLPVQFGKYRLLKRIAQGGMADIFLAKYYGISGFEKTLVIKRILPSLTGNLKFIDMFIREAKICVSMNHPNIVQVFDLNREGDDYFIAMEYLHGKDLSKLIKKVTAKGEKITLPMTLFIVSEVAKGLDYAHSRGSRGGVVHSDISPQNIMVSFAGDTKILDFGIAHLKREVKGEKEILAGKVAYMSPEQASGEEIDGRSDIYSLGVVLYELLSGKRLFGGDTLKRKLKRVMQADVPPIESVAEDVHPRLKSIVERCLKRDRRERYKKGADLYEDIKAFLFEQGHFITNQELGRFVTSLFPGEDSMDGLETSPVPSLPGAAGNVRARLQEVSKDLRTTPSAIDAEEGKKKVVCMAVELSGVTRISEEKDEITFVRFQFRFLKTIAGVVKRYDGYVDHYFNNRLTLFWGIPKASREDLNNALSGALEIVREVERLRRENSDFEGVSIGIHTGFISLGGTGGKGKLRYIPRGDVIHMAHLLAGEGKNDTILVSPKVMEAGRGSFLFEESHPLRSGRGKEKRENPFLLKGERKREAGIIRATKEKRGEWVDRSSSLRVMKEAIERVKMGNLSIMEVMGEAGMGKTRFLMEVLNAVKGEGFVPFYWEAFHHGSEISLSAIKGLLGAILGFGPDDKPEKLKGCLEKLLYLNLDPLEIKEIGLLSGIEEEGERGRGVIPLEEEVKRQILFAGIAHLFHEMGQKRPLCIILENIQWSDTYSLDLIHFAMKRLEDSSILFVFTYRPGFYPPWSDFYPLFRIHIRGMKMRELEAFIRTLLNVQNVPAPFLRFIHSRCGGNPLFIEEVIKGLLISERIARKGKRLEFKGDEKGEGPLFRGMREEVTTTIDSLPAPHKRVLQIAATIGRVFQWGLLKSVIKEVEDPERVLLELMDREFIVKEEEKEDTCRFRTPFLWEVAYWGILKNRLREYHRRVGLAMEGYFRDISSSTATMISNHFEMAGDAEKAVKYLEMAGEKYESEFQTRSAIQSYSKALALLSETRDYLDGVPDVEKKALALWDRLGNLHTLLGNFREAERSFLKCLQSMADIEGGEIYEIKGLMGLAEVFYYRNELPRAMRYLENALIIAREMGESLFTTEILSRMGYILTTTRDKAGAESRFFDALQEAQGGGYTDAEAKILNGLGLLHLKKGEFERSAYYLNKAIALFPQFDDILLIGRIHNSLGNALEGLGRYEDALDSYRTSIKYLEETGYWRGRILNLFDMGKAYLKMGDSGKAYTNLSDSLDMARRVEWEKGISMNLLWMGYIVALSGWGRTKKGINTIKEGIDIAKKIDDEELEALGYGLLARVYMETGKKKDARRYEKISEEIAERLGASLLLQEVRKDGTETGGGAGGVKPP